MTESININVYKCSAVPTLTPPKTRLTEKVALFVKNFFSKLSAFVSHLSDPYNSTTAIFSDEISYNHHETKSKVFIKKEATLNSFEDKKILFKELFGEKELLKATFCKACSIQH